MSLQVHGGVRWIRAAGTLATPIDKVDRGIMPGCTLSTSLSRAYLRDVVGAVGESDGHRVYEQVDDMAQVIAAASHLSAKINAINHAKTMGR